MDAESSYESDISESWSLIDISLNEELFPATESSLKLKNNSSSKLKNVKLRKIDEMELEDFLRRPKERNKMDFNQINHSDSDSSFKNQELGTYSRTEFDKANSSCKLSFDNDEKNDSGDAESIEILEMDGNCQDSEIDRLEISEIDPVGFATYQSDDEESSEGRNINENRSNSSTVIKRKRRRLNKNPDNTVHNVNSENKFSAKSISKAFSDDIKEENDNCIEKTSKAIGHPVYKHYRNNVANTALSLSVCVIFAGVACIAIGHFLGVQNSTETAVELMEALKKLQVENSALQSRLFHMNRALLSREMNSKLELPLDQLHSKASCESFSQLGPSKPKDVDLSNAALSEIRSSLNSIEWLSRLQNVVSKNNKETETENGNNFKAFGKYIHDELCVLNNRKGEGTSYLGNTDRKISKVIQKIINRLLISKDNIENLYHKLIKLKDKLNHRLSKIVTDASKLTKSRRLKHKNKVPVTELDLQTMQWKPKNEIQENSNQEYPESVAIYKFPQPEEYYKIENALENINEMHVEPMESCKTVNENDFEKAQKAKKNEKKYKQKYESEKKKEKKNKRKNRKREEPKEKSFDKNKGDRRKNLLVNKFSEVVGKTENINKNKDAVIESRHIKDKIRKRLLNETNYQSKRHLESRGKNLKFKRRFNKIQDSKLKKVLLPKLKKESYFRKNQFIRMCSEPQCFNLTGHWVFKWADGREEYRRYQSLGDWQFERAKARKEGRDIDFNNWQFERANSRKELRGNDYSENWQFKRALSRESNRNDDHSRRGKYTKFNDKEFFHERFSWI